MKIFKRLVLVFLSMILAVNLFSSAMGEEVAHTWDCPECGRTGNTGKFCGNCGNPDPASMEAPSLPDNIFAFNMSVDELDQKVKELLQKAASWDESTSPQTLDEFPLLPDNFSDIYNYVSHLDNSLIISDNTKVTWKTGLRDYLISINPGEPNPGTSIGLLANHSTATPDFAYLQNDLYSIELNGVPFEDLTQIGLHTYWSSQINETLSVEYMLEKGNFTGEGQINIQLNRNDGEYGIQWIINGSATVDIYMSHQHTDMFIFISYNAETGERIAFSSH